ncbi:MAG: response regulator transcription factor, partial [Actinobacteria bacterium]|nr:response regulator transcription factor [Actinomycetota bacterium]
FSAESPAGQGAETTAAGSTADFVLTSILDVVHPDDVVQVLEAFEAAVVSAEAQAEVPVRCGPSGRATRMLVKCTGGPDRFGVTVGASDGARHAIDSDRAVELERRLRRIADEIEAAGLFQRAALVPDPDDVPGLEALSSRQWEVVTRLLRGERVPRIARAMYLSPSTVRNHLSTIFRKLGVHSQAELIDRLYPPE